MRILGHRKLFIRATLSLLFVFMLGSKAFTATEAELLASDGAANDSFGQSVSISGDVALVGAAEFGDDDESISSYAYVFRWNGTSWVEEQKLVASDGSMWDYFGDSASISGNVALVGASGDDDNGDESGSAYVFSVPDPPSYCHLLTPSSPIPANYGSPYNLAENKPNELLISTTCDTNSVNLFAGTGNSNQYIYREGYIYDGTNWQQYDLSGSNPQYTDWYLGNASAQNIPVADMSAVNYIVAYVCIWDGL